LYYFIQHLLICFLGSSPKKKRNTLVVSLFKAARKMKIAFVSVKARQNLSTKTKNGNNKDPLFKRNLDPQ